MRSNAESFFCFWVSLILLVSGCKSPSQEKPVTLTATETNIGTQPVSTVLAPTTSTSESQSEGQSLALLPADRAGLASFPDLTHYTIDVAIDEASTGFTGHALVELTNITGQPQDSLYFRLLPNAGQSYGNGSLTVTQTRIGGQPAVTSLSLDDSALQVDLPGSLQPGQRVQVEFDFQGVVPVDFGGDQSPAAYGIYNFSHGVLALSGWYPILAIYDEKGWHLDPVSPLGDSVFSQTALYTVKVTVPSDVVLAATGVEVGRQSAGDVTTHDLVSGPARDFFLAASTDYKVATQTVGGTRINSYYLPGDVSPGAAGLSAAAGALSVYNRRFGAYPFAELDVVEAPLRNALGVEYPEIVMIGASLYEKPDDPSFSVTIAHEVAHQWWYSLVGNDVFAEPWLDEGLSTYSSGVYSEDALGEGFYQGLVSYWQGRVDKLVEEGKDDLVTADLGHFESLGDPGVYGGVVYSKAALFFKALREAIGDKAFFAALQQYAADNEYRVATGEELLKTFEKASGQQLDSLYQEWLYSKK